MGIFHRWDFAFDAFSSGKPVHFSTWINKRLTVNLLFYLGSKISFTGGQSMTKILLKRRKCRTDFVVFKRATRFRVRLMIIIQGVL